MSKHSKNKSNFKRTVIILLSIILVCSIILIIKIKYDEYKDNERQKEISQVLDTIDVPSEDITPEQTERMLQVAQLKAENEEVIGWLEIQGTNISYPVLQGKDNNYYLTNN